jgi:hypothetical protein
MAASAIRKASSEAPPDVQFRMSSPKAAASAKVPWEAWRPGRLYPLGGFLVVGRTGAQFYFVTQLDQFGTEGGTHHAGSQNAYFIGCYFLKCWLTGTKGGQAYLYFTITVKEDSICHG